MDDREEIENSIEDSDRNWKRVIDSATKVGYREGIEEGKQSVFQQGFDIGYEDAFKTAFLLGKYKGLAFGLDCDNRHPFPVSEVLDKTRQGACYICVKDSDKSKSNVDDFVEPPIEETRSEQKIHSEQVVRSLHQHFDNLSKERGISIDNFML